MHSAKPATKVLSLFIAPSLLNGLAERHVPELFAPSMKRERHCTDRCGSKSAFHRVCVTERELAPPLLQVTLDGAQTIAHSTRSTRCWSLDSPARGQSPPFQCAVAGPPCARRVINTSGTIRAAKQASTNKASR